MENIITESCDGEDVSRQAKEAENERGQGSQQGQNWTYRTYIQHSHWSSSYIAALSLVETCRVLKYFHALEGPIIGALSVATLGLFLAPRWFFMA